MQVIPDVLEEGEAEKLRKYFEGLKWDVKRQRRGFTQSFGGGLPGEGEWYSASFQRAYNAQLDWVGDRLRKHFPEGTLDLRAHWMSKGGHFRCHVDDQVGGYGFTLTLSKGWKWDWGGILNVGEDPVQVLPRWNELVVIHGEPHWVTPVCEWALEPRYTLVGFVR